jgi:hypothetical protein
MRRWSCAVLALLLAAALPARAEPLDPALQKQLLELYDRYNQAIAAGKIDDAIKTRSAALQKQMKSELKTAKSRKEFLGFAKDMTPDTIEVRRATLSPNGTHATIKVLASKTVPEGLKNPDAPPPGTTMRSEVTLDFVKEKGGWKYDNQTFGMDPDKIVACPDVRFEPIEAYDQDRDTSMGGPIVRVDFNADHTLVVVRVVDEETCAFLPDRATLEKAKFDVAKLVPDAIVEIEGFPHKTDKQKVWVDQLKMHDE